MPPRGNEGLDFTPIFTHYFFLLSILLAVIGWFIAFVSQAIANADEGRGSVGVLWFAIFLQLFLTLGVIYTLASDSIAMHRFQISVFGAIAIVFAVLGVNQGIFSSVGSQDAYGAGWLILAMVDIVWVLFFTAEEDSLMFHIFNMWGTGGLTPPSRRRRTRQQSVHDMNNGYTNSYASGGGIGNHDFENKLNSGMGTTGPALRSQNSFGAASADAPGGVKSLSAGSLRNAPISAGTGSAAGDVGASSPLMGSAGNAPLSTAAPSVGKSETQQGGDGFVQRAKALYAYTASPDDANEISFSKGEIVEIVDTQGKWWQAKKSDGTIGIAPSNYLQMI